MSMSSLRAIRCRRAAPELSRCVPTYAGRLHVISTAVYQPRGQPSVRAKTSLARTAAGNSLAARYTAKALAEQRIAAENLPREASDWAHDHVQRNSYLGVPATEAVTIVNSIITFFDPWLWHSHGGVREVKLWLTYQQEADLNRLVEPFLPSLPKTNPGIYLDFYYYLIDKGNIYSYALAIKIAQHFSMASSFLLYLNYAHFLRSVKTGELAERENLVYLKKLLKTNRNDLPSLLHRPLLWVPYVLRGLAEEISGDYEKAMLLYVEATNFAPAEVVADREDPRVRRAFELLYDLCGCTLPWTCGIDLILRARSNPQLSDALRSKLYANAMPLIEKGIAADDARAHYLAAMPYEAQYVQQQTREMYDSASESTRPPRKQEDVGKPAMWLYYMTRAAATGQPDAMVELGEYYWRTPHRHIDDEPPDRLKPSPLDRWPPEKDSRASTIATNILHTLGIAGLLNRYRPDSSEDVFENVSFMKSAEDRTRLAFQWIETAADLGYAPALRLLLEISTSEYLPVDTSVPAQSKTPFASKAAYFDAIFKGNEHAGIQEAISPPDPQNMPLHTRLANRASSLWSVQAVDEVPGRIKNPCYSMLKAQQYAIRGIKALRARHLWRAFAAKYKAPDARHGLDTATAYKRFRRLVEVEREEVWDDYDEWLRHRDVFSVWQDEDAECEALRVTIEHLAKKHEWELREWDGRLVIVPDRKAFNRPAELNI